MSTLKRVSILLLLAGLLLDANHRAKAQQPSGQSPEAITLEPGKPIERELAGRDVHAYQITLATGQFLRAVVEQRGVDVVVTVVGPDGLKLAEIDSPTGTQGSEVVEVAAQASGPYRLELRVFAEEGTGRYEINVEQLLTAEQYTAERAKQDAAIQWLKQHAIPLRTVEAGQGFDDLQPLKKLIGQARLVALGEATHGTREFFQLKHRMLEFLVTELGFTIFGIEATMPEAFDINEYVLTGNGDPVKALAGLYFWTWNTEEVLEMIQWMRRYNADPRHTRKVKFYGFDMQYAPRAVKVTLNYLRTVDPEQAVAAEQAFAVLANPYTAPDFATLSKEKKEATMAAARVLLTRFEERQQEYIARTSETEWAFARQHARIVAQNIELILSFTSPDGFAVRDSAMAENIRWILDHEGPEAKIVVWAHNGHVATQPGEMGTHLRKMFGSEMVVFGFAFNQGAFQAIEASRGLRSFHVGPAPEGSLDAALAAADLHLAAIDLHVLPKDGPVAEWFGAPRVTRSIGAGYSEQAVATYLAKMGVPRLYDALLFVETTTAARANPGGQRFGAQRLTAPANLDFEGGKPGTSPADWRVPPWAGNFDFVITTSEDRPYRGQRCVMISRTPIRHYGEQSGNLQQQIDATAYRGKRVRLRAAVRTDVAEPGSQAYLWLRVMKKGFGPAAVAFYDNMADRPITTREWREYEIVGEVSADAETIDYGLALVGDGRAWIDAVSIEVINK